MTIVLPKLSYKLKSACYFTTSYYFKGINFRGYKFSRLRDFFGVRESLYPRNRLLSGTRESLYPWNITFMGVIEISIKNHQKWRQNKRISPKFHAIAKVYTRKISERHHSRKFIPAEVNFGPRWSRKFIPAKVYTNKVAAGFLDVEQGSMDTN